MVDMNRFQPDLFRSDSRKKHQQKCNAVSTSGQAEKVLPGGYR